MELGGIAWRGWFPCGDELTSGKPDQKEGLYLGTELGPDHPMVQRGVPMHGANLFPDSSLPELRTVVLEWIGEMTRLAQIILEGIALALGLAPEYFRADLTRDPTCLFRIFNYPEQKGEARTAETWGVGQCRREKTCSAKGLTCCTNIRLRCRSFFSQVNTPTTVC